MDDNFVFFVENNGSKIHKEFALLGPNLIYKNVPHYKQSEFEEMIFGDDDKENTEIIELYKRNDRAVTNKMLFEDYAVGKRIVIDAIVHMVRY